MSEGASLPDDPFHAHLYVWLTTSETACCDCKVRPDLNWAWDGVPEGEAGCDMFAIRAVKFMKAAGWHVTERGLLCPECAAARFSQIRD